MGSRMYGCNGWRDVVESRGGVDSVIVEGIIVGYGWDGYGFIEIDGQGCSWGVMVSVPLVMISNRCCS